MRNTLATPPSSDRACAAVYNEENGDRAVCLPQPSSYVPTTTMDDLSKLNKTNFDLDLVPSAPLTTLTWALIGSDPYRQFSQSEGSIHVQKCVIDSIRGLCTPGARARALSALAALLRWQIMLMLMFKLFIWCDMFVCVYM